MFSLANLSCHQVVRSKWNNRLSDGYVSFGCSDDIVRGQLIGSFDVICFKEIIVIERNLFRERTVKRWCFTSLEWLREKIEKRRFLRRKNHLPLSLNIVEEEYNNISRHSIVSKSFYCDKRCQPIQNVCPFILVKWFIVVTLSILHVYLISSLLPPPSQHYHCVSCSEYQSDLMSNLFLFDYSAQISWPSSWQECVFSRLSTWQISQGDYNKIWNDPLRPTSVRHVNFERNTSFVQLCLIMPIRGRCEGFLKFFWTVVYDDTARE